MAQITRVFADYNSTTPLCPPVLDRMKDWAKLKGNLSSGHFYGQQMHGVYDQACDRIKQHLSASKYDLLTCSSATEANNWWFYSILINDTSCPRVITTPIEHPCVLSPLLQYAKQGRIDLQVCDVDQNGQIDLAHLESLLTNNTKCISVMMANNEIGTIQPIDAVVRLAQSVGALVHSDMVQAVGKIPIDLDALGVDALSLSAHKCYAPTGLGVLMVKNTQHVQPWIIGGEQQQR